MANFEDEASARGSTGAPRRFWAGAAPVGFWWRSARNLPVAATFSCAVCCRGAILLGGSAEDDGADVVEDNDRFEEFLAGEGDEMEGPVVTGAR